MGVLEIFGGWVSKHPPPLPWGWDNSGSLGVMMHGIWVPDAKGGTSNKWKRSEDCSSQDSDLMSSQAPPIHHVTQAVTTRNRLLICFKNF